MRLTFHVMRHRLKQERPQGPAATNARKLDLMTSRSQNRIWLVLTLVLTMVTAAMGPAVVPACADLNSAVSHPTAAAAGCAETGASGSCCCDAGEKAPAPSGSGLQASSACGCAVEAPSAPAPAAKATVVTVSFPANAPPRGVSLELPLSTLDALPSLSPGQPHHSYRSSTPSRTPPAR